MAKVKFRNGKRLYGPNDLLATGCDVNVVCCSYMLGPPPSLVGCTSDAPASECIDEGGVSRRPCPTCDSCADCPDVIACCSTGFLGGLPYECRYSTSDSCVSGDGIIVGTNCSGVTCPEIEYGICGCDPDDSAGGNVSVNWSGYGFRPLQCSMQCLTEYYSAIRSQLLQFLSLAHAVPLTTFGINGCSGQITVLAAITPTPCSGGTPANFFATIAVSASAGGLSAGLSFGSGFGGSCTFNPPQCGGGCSPVALMTPCTVGSGGVCDSTLCCVGGLNTCYVNISW